MISAARRGEVAVDLFLGTLAGVADAALEVTRQFVHPRKLVAQVDCGLAAGGGGAGDCGFEFGDEFVGAPAHRRFERGLAALGQALGNLADRGIGLFGQPGGRIARCAGQALDCRLQCRLDMRGQRVAFAARLRDVVAHSGKVRALPEALLLEPAVQRGEFAGRLGQSGAGGDHVVGQRFAAVPRLAERLAHCKHRSFHPLEPVLGPGQSVGKLLAGVVGACLDQFEQADAAVGEPGDRLVGPGQRLAAGDQAFGQDGQTGKRVISVNKFYLAGG